MVFNSKLIRQTTVKLRTDRSARYEKGINNMGYYLQFQN